MNLTRTCLLAGFLAVAGLAGAADFDGSKPVKATANENFSVRLPDGENCGQVKPYDKINLLINGMDTGLHPLGCDPGAKELTFVLERDTSLTSPASNAAWKLMLGKPFHTVQSEFKRNLPYAVERQDLTGTKVLGNGSMELTLVRPGQAFLGGLLVVGLWGFLVTLGRKSGMLRDAGNPGHTLQDRTYSLARVQMAWWFAIIMGAYVFLWVMTGDIPPLSGQALLLMGVSGATGLASVSLDASKQGILPLSSGKFLDDLLTDAHGVTLHRFQMLAMTVILGVMFISHVATNLTMPTFDGSLLALMGIAGGTYVGFKFPEQQVSPTNGALSVPAGATPEDHKAGYTPEANPAG